jgi:hypothetical protein
MAKLLWIMTELAIIGSDIQEVIGSAIAFKILWWAAAGVLASAENMPLRILALLRPFKHCLPFEQVGHFCNQRMRSCSFMINCVRVPRYRSRA